MKNLLLLFALGASLSLYAQKKPSLSYYLPETNQYNAAIPTPEQFFGHQIGEAHASHDQIQAYIRELDRLSDRMSLEVLGRSHEFRPILMLTITSPENHRNLEAIRLEHLKLTDAYAQVAAPSVEKMPIIVYQGHSIHGNEASGANAALLAAYHWAAAQGAEVETILQNTVILFDPCFNPDGVQRFSQWANMHRAKNLVSDPQSREFSEVYPYGRTNHYWFDLNRDWLVSQQPESQARVKFYHAWKPNILTDHHEMGSNASFFFQPGVPTRTNPYTPKRNFELTGKIAEYHAKALDRIGSQYFTKEGYDDFYYGKGSTYPDLQGCIGILFEQASARGHAQRTANGILTFPFTIRNQLTTSFSTIEAAQAMRVELLNYQRDFFKQAAADAAKDKVKAYVFGEKYDYSRLHAFLEMLRRNQIRVYELGRTHKNFEKGKAYIIPLAQPQYRLIKANFERYLGDFYIDSLFYDISAWTLPLAFNIETTNLEGDLPNGIVGKEITETPFPTGEIAGGKSDYGYAFEWDDYFAPQLLNAILSENLMAKVMTSTTKIGVNTAPRTPLNGEGARSEQYLNLGSIFIPVQNQSKSSDALFAFLQNAVKKTGVRLHSIKSGLATEGVDLGSGSLLPVRRPNVALLVGEGVTNNDAGEIWHLLDTRYDMPVTLLDIMSTRWSLAAYSCVIMPDGNYSAAVAGRIKDYLSGGGTVIALGKTSRFLKSYDLCFADIKSATKFEVDKAKKKPNNHPSYADMEEIAGKELIRGAIFEVEGDMSHPLFFGYRQNKIPIFREENDFFEQPTNAFAAPLSYTNSPLLSGYLSDRNKAMSSRSAAIVVSAVGTGKVISMVDNPNFRAFWYGTNKLMANMIFFGNLIKAGSMETAKAVPEAKK
jgi:hypothetical protein